MKLQHFFLFVFVSFLAIKTQSVDGSGTVTLTAEQLAAFLAFAADNGIDVSDVDECAKTIPVCPAHSFCTNFEASYNCTCNDGYNTTGTDGNGATECTDIDECNTAATGEVDPCADITDAECMNSEGSYECQCTTGFEHNENRTACVDINECTDDATCSTSGPSTCKNTNGSYVCNCNNGYSKDADGVCQNIDECTTTEHGCLTNQDCVDNNGSFACKCKTGFTASDPPDEDCVDINECSSDPNACADISGTTCVNNDASFTCPCTVNGYQVEGNTCVDIDECDPLVMGHNCSTNEKCVNTDPSFKCECAEGYAGDPDEDSCTDIDECANNPCDVNAACKNELGGHLCFCETGFFGSGESGDCHDVLSCDTFDSVKAAIVAVRDSSTSDDVTSSTQTLRQYASASGKAEEVPGDTYRDAFVGTIDADIANVIDKLRCDFFSSCSEPSADVTSHTCACHEGYEPYVDPKTNITSVIQCQDVNECSDPASCGTGATCGNTEGSYTCTCETGFELSGNITSNCTDIDECSLENPTHDCHKDADCTNIDASFTCTCKEGFFGDGTECTASYTCAVFNNVRNEIDILRTSVDDNAVAEATTFLTQYINTAGITSTVSKNTYSKLFTVVNGSLEANAVELLICDYRSDCTTESSEFSCTCHEGYVALPLNENECTDVEECSTTEGCGVTGECVNNQGGFSCTCNGGYEGGETGPCTDINECTLETDECGATGTCDNVDGSYTCVCHPGYEGGADGPCTNINECDTGANNCDVNATCTDSVGSFDCACNEGYAGNGVDCSDIDECSSATLNTCDQVNGDCLNNPGGYTCSCNSGFMFSGTGNDCESATSCAAFDKVKQAVAELRVAPNVTANEQILQRYIDAEGKVPGVSGVTYNLAYPGESNALITQVIGLLRCDYFSTCSEDPVDVFECICIAGYEAVAGSDNQCIDVDECSSAASNNCDENASCRDTEGSYECTCNDGYDGNGVVCNDIDECDNATLNTCDNNAECNNTLGSYTCACKSTFMGTGQDGDCTSVLLCSTFNNVKQAIDNIRMATGADNTSADVLTLQQYAAATGRAAGVSGDAYRAAFGAISSAEITSVIDELRCDYFSKCSEPIDALGKYVCTCNDGYEFFTDSGSQCTDIDECEETTDNCHANATCINTEGGFECNCTEGYFGNGTTCSDHDECDGEGGGHDCDENAKCDNIEGGHTCACNESYFGDGYDGNCIAVNTCETFNNIKTAIDTVRTGGVNVEAARTTLKEYAAALGLPALDTGDSYILEHGTPLDVDIESVISHLICDYHSSCSGDGTTTTCTCNENFISLGDDVKCFSVKSCPAFTAVKAAIKDVNNKTDNSTDTAAREILTSYASQTDFATPASNASYVARYGAATDAEVNSALNLLRCDFFSTCNYTDGEYTCLCEVGYEQATATNECQDLNECDGENNCNVNAGCTNNEGSFSCACNIGFAGDGVDCNDSTECDSPDSTLCGSNAICEDTVGSFTCTCNEGYQGDGIVCKEIHDCLFSGDAVPAGSECSDFGHPLSCSFEKEFAANAEDHFEAYSSFFKTPSGLTSSSSGRNGTDFVIPVTSTGLCMEGTTHTSPQKAFTDAAGTTEEELFSFSCHRQWFIETECTATPTNINGRCENEYSPRNALIIQQDGSKYEVVEKEIYLPSSCKFVI